ncbi:hypothetical protein [Streptomyces klenkii]
MADLLGDQIVGPGEPRLHASERTGPLGVGHAEVQSTFWGSGTGNSADGGTEQLVCFYCFHGFEDASALATTIRAEVSRDEPDPGTLRRAVAALKGYLAPIAITTVTAGAAVGGEETAHALIERLGNAL